MVDTLCEIQDCYWKSIDPEPVDRLVEQYGGNGGQAELIDQCKSRCLDHALRLIASESMKLDNTHTVSRVRSHLKDAIALREQYNA